MASVPPPPTDHTTSGPGTSSPSTTHLGVPNHGTSGHRAANVGARHPAVSSRTASTGGDTPIHSSPVEDATPAVVPLNAAAELFAALAENIRGSAVDWPPTALEKLERSLLERYGELLGGEQAIERLVELAGQSEAA